MDRNKNIRNVMQMPAFKKGDLVRSKVELHVHHAPSSKNTLTGLDPTNPHRPVYETSPVDSTPVKDLPIEAGIIFEVDEVLPWGDPTDVTPSLYRLKLFPLTYADLSQEDKQRVQREYFGLRVILGHEDTLLPFYAYADEEDLNLILPVDRREPGFRVIEFWRDDEFFVWSASLTFPDGDDILSYEIDYWENKDEEDDPADQGYGLEIRPIFFANSSDGPLLSLRIRPGYEFGASRPYIDFQAQRWALCMVDLEEHEVSIEIKFKIALDFEARRWEFATP